MSKPFRFLKRTLILSHRWMGVAFALLFAWWFISGIVMMFQGYPRVAEEDRLARAPVLDGARIRVGPAEATQAAGMSGRIEQIRLRMFDGRPAYLIRASRRQMLVYADDGTVQRVFGDPLRRRVAAAWSGQSIETAGCGEVGEPDQWTVSGTFRTLRPLTKCAWPNGDEVYVSGVTGEVVQATTRASRIAAYFGAIPHYIYFTPLRVNQPVWRQVVIWLSGIGTIMAILGLAAGFIFLSPRRRYVIDGRRSAIPFAGTKRLHTTLGFFIGILACTWAFSGMMSLDPFPAAGASERRGGGRLRLQRPPDPRSYQSLPPERAVAALAGKIKVRQLELMAVHGDPLYLASESTSRALWVGMNGEAFARFNMEAVEGWVRAALRPAQVIESRVVHQYEIYYGDRRGRRPLPVLALHLNDPGRSVYFVDPARAAVVQVVNDSSRWRRWLYRGLHSLDLPWLYRFDWIWYTVVLALMLCGTALSITAVLLGWRRVFRR